MSFVDIHTIQPAAVVGRESPIPTVEPTIGRKTNAMKDTTAIMQ